MPWNKGKCCNIKQYHMEALLRPDLEKKNQPNRYFPFTGIVLFLEYSNR